MPDTMCSFCKAIPPDLFRFDGYGYGYTHAPSYKHLEESAQNGCRPCNVFINALQNVGITGCPITLFSLPAGSYSLPIIDGGHTTTTDHIFIQCGPPPIISIDGVPQFCLGNQCAGLSWLIQPATPHERAIGPAEYLNQDPGCHQNIELITGLMKNCLSDHPYCRAKKQSSLPTRVLDLGEDPDVTIVRIVPGSHCAERQGRYMTLSHCWGNPPADVPWKLTTERMEKFASEVPFDIIPKTFREAIDLVKKIGERYLWIDSLCIVQDSKKDWEAEASRMADVYGDSLCTISTATNNTDSGCFLSRKGTSLQGIEWELSDPRFNDNFTNTTVILIPSLRYTEDPPVFGRAWCLQERELSHRLLQFSTDGWTWKCPMLMAEERELYSENFDYHGKPKGALTLQLVDRELSGLDMQLHRMKEHITGKLATSRFVRPSFFKIAAMNDRTKGHEYWQKIMSIFSRTKITNPSDRIPALHGLITRQAFVFPGNYAYGTWELDVIPELAWTCIDDTGINTRPEPEVAPTWSWLSVQSPIRFQGIETENIEPDTHMWFENWDNKTMVTAIRGQARLMEMECSQDKQDLSGSHSDNSRHALSLRGKVSYDTLHDRELVRYFYCLPLESCHRPFSNEGMSTVGLALVRVPWTKDGVPTFRRVGLYQGPVISRSEVQEFRII